MKFYILIYWCQMNYADSARIATVLKNIWFKQVKNIEEADIIIFDTCSVRQKAEDKITWKLKEIPSNKKIWITWCMIQKNLSKKRLQENENISKNWKWKFKKGNFIWNIENLKENDISSIINSSYQPIRSSIKKKFKNLELLFRIDDVHLLPQIIKHLWYDIKNKQIQSINSYINLQPEISNQTWNENIKTAYVPISTWCNQFCSYCIVPFARWLEKNRQIWDIIKEINYWTQKWKEEIVLVGQIVNKHPNFYEILKKTLENPKIKWLRYTSPYPIFYTKEIFKLHEQEERLCPHIHIPLQSWSDKILKLMNRWYSIEQFKNFIDNIKKINRNISITTDIIVWFPNETEKDFEDSLKITEYAKFDMIYIWIYSPRPNTKAYKNLKDDISKKDKQQRWNQLNNLLYKISSENNNKEIWKIKKAMIVGKKNGQYFGYTDDMKNIELSTFNETNIWKIIDVKIIDSISLKIFWKEL